MLAVAQHPSASSLLPWPPLEGVRIFQHLHKQPTRTQGHQVLMACTFLSPLEQAAYILFQWFTLER